MHRLGVGLAAALLCSACAVPSLDSGELDGALAAARCERFVTCGVFPSTDECMRVFPAVTDQDTAAAIADGKITYHGDFAQQCADGLAAVSCDLTSHAARALPDACRYMLEGNLAEGADCSFDKECDSRRCEIDAAGSCSNDTCCAGTCGASAPAAEDEACLRSVDCADALYCGEDLVCHAVGEDGDPCTSDAQCDLDLACTNSTCSAPALIGDDCSFARCGELGAYCDATTMLCTAVKAPGDACASGAECSPYAICDTVCKLVAARGASCHTVPCEATSRCDAATETCAALLDNDMPCDEGHECTSGYCKPGAVFDTCADKLVCD